MTLVSHSFFPFSPWPRQPGYLLQLSLVSSLTPPASTGISNAASEDSAPTTTMTSFVAGTQSPLSWGQAHPWLGMGQAGGSEGAIHSQCPQSPRPWGVHFDSQAVAEGGIGKGVPERSFSLFSWLQGLRKTSGSDQETGCMLKIVQGLGGRQTRAREGIERRLWERKDMYEHGPNTAATVNSGISQRPYPSAV